MSDQAASNSPLDVTIPESSDTQEPASTITFGSHDTLPPEPMRVRRQWESLNGTWDFAIDRDGQWDRPHDVQWSTQIQVPFAPETKASGVEDTGYYMACWYRRSFKCPALENGQRVILYFGAVDYIAKVWVDDKMVCEHEGGFTPFHVDITPYLTGDEQHIILQARDDPHDLAKPRGKQDWQLHPHSIWYPRTTGIWQAVWMEVVGSSWLSQISWTPDFERFAFNLHCQIAHYTEQLRLRVELRVNDRLLADDLYTTTGDEIQRHIVLSDPGIDDYRNELLWSPERPTLITANLELQDMQGQVIDQVQSYTAMRQASTLGDRFMLNGRPRYLRLVLDQGYWPDTGLTPPDDQAIRRDIELIQAMGFNGVRAHQHISDPRFLYLADVMGLLVWEEMPSAYRFSTQMVHRVTQEWTQVIKRDRSHPCIIAWVPMNESWGVPDLPSNDVHRSMIRAMYHLTKTLDDSRPVIGNDGWEMIVTDIVAIHDYDSSPQRIVHRYENASDPRPMLRMHRPGHRVLLLKDSVYRGQPIMLTEFGGIALREEGKWGYSEATNPQEFLERYTGLLQAVHALPVFSGFCYTQFTDTYQEANGLVYADRTPKADVEAIRRATQG